MCLGCWAWSRKTIDPDAVESILRRVHDEKRLTIADVGEIEFDPDTHLRFEVGDELPRHTNGMRFVAKSGSGEVLADEKYYSLGGGFIARNDEPEPTNQEDDPPFLFDSGNSLLQVASENGPEHC